MSARPSSTSFFDNVDRHFTVENKYSRVDQLVDQFRQSYVRLVVVEANRPLIELPEQGNLSRARIAKPAGLVPLNCDS